MNLPFASWSRIKIATGKKWATSRSRSYDDPRVLGVVWLPLSFVRDHLYQVEGAESPEEFEKVWKGIHKGVFDEKRMVCVHFGDFKEETKC